MKHLKLSLIVGLIFTLTIGITVFATYDALESSRAKDEVNYANLQATQFELRQLENQLSEMKALEKEDLKTYCLGVQSTAMIALEQEYSATPEQKEKWEKLKVRSCEDYYTDTLKFVYTGPNNMKYSFLKSQGTYVTQTPAQHLQNWGTIAIDIGTGKKKIPVYAPALELASGNEEREYTVRLTTNKDTTGKTVNLDWEEDGVKNSFLLGHLSEFKVKTGDIVKTGDLVGISGGDGKEDFSKGIHLHFEYRINDISVPYPTWEYDLHKPMEVKEEIKEEKGNFIEPKETGIEAFLQTNGADFVKERTELFKSVGEHYNIKPEVLVCIAQADSSLGKALKTKNNIGNVGNTDSGRTQSCATLEACVEDMARVLNNKYLGSYTTIGQLSRGGGNKDGAIYASSEYNWNKNVKACLQSINGDKSINESFNFRQ